MYLKTGIHVNLNVTPKDLQQEVAWGLFLKWIVKDKDRDLYRPYLVATWIRIKKKCTFEKSSHFDPSVKVTDMMPDLKCASPLHLGNMETLYETQTSDSSDPMEANCPYWLSTSFTAGRPAASIFPFKTFHIWLLNKPRWNACKRSNDRAWYGSEFLKLQKTFYQTNVTQCECMADKSDIQHTWIYRRP